MTLLAVPNVSEGRDDGVLRRFAAVLEAHGAAVLDVHSDATHNRSVLTVTAGRPELVDSLAELATAARAIDLTSHEGAHPRLGCLDVCPIVPHDEPMAAAVEVARDTGREIATRASLPVFLYGNAARRDSTRELPDIRRGGLGALMERMEAGFEPDFGPSVVDPRAGVVCVGARRPLVAFNVALACDLSTAARVAAIIRASAGGMRGVRALGFPTNDADLSQVSMNLTAPDHTGVDDAFDEVARVARSFAVKVVSTEIIGLPPQRYLPNPDAEAARLLVRPGRSLESMLRAATG